MTQMLSEIPFDTGVSKYSPHSFPAPATDLLAIPSGSTIELSWNGTASEYAIYRDSLYKATVSDTDWIDTVVSGGTNYVYSVVAVEASYAEGYQYSVAVTTAPLVYSGREALNTDPVHTSSSATIIDGTHLVTWDDSNKPATRNYRQYVNGILQGASEVNTTSKLVTVPMNGSMVTITTEFWDSGDLGTLESISYQIQTAFYVTDSLSGYTKVVLPVQDTIYGGFGLAKLGELMSPALPWFIDGSGDVAVGHVEGARAIVARLRPQTTAKSSNVIKSAVFLPTIISDTTPIKLAFEMRLRTGFSFGINNSMQMAKLGFGLRNMIGKSWSAQWIMRGNGNGTANLDIYTVTAKTVSSEYGDVCPTGHQLQINKWSQYIMEIVLNTPNQSNGIMRVWVNGDNVCEITDMRYQASGIPSLSAILFENSFGYSGTGWRPANTSYAEFKNVAWKIG